MRIPIGEMLNNLEKDRPNDKIKNYKNMYVKGIISKLHGSIC